MVQEEVRRLELELLRARSARGLSVVPHGWWHPMRSCMGEGGGDPWSGLIYIYMIYIYTYVYIYITHTIYCKWGSSTFNCTRSQALNCFPSSGRQRSSGQNGCQMDGHVQKPRPCRDCSTEWLQRHGSLPAHLLWTPEPMCLPQTNLT